ncbi:MAG: Gfo/Idh/MocA family oxidoreductase, partial [Planctomycetes bacterium]|nr:Gfo/Idh/MocA family oxidoreductase [Planctomycetota bacterium]
MTENSRRKFIKNASLTFGCTILPSYLTAAKNSKNSKKQANSPLPPSERVNIGCIGVGGRAKSVIPSLAKDGAHIVALCDVDFKWGSKTIAANPQAQTFHDFRVMLDKVGKDIDAVSVVTPDHTHFTAAIASMALGKHVYVEKPLTHTFEESEILMRAEKKFGVVTQMGNQGHTSTGYHQFGHLVNKGIISNIVKMEAWKTPSLWFMKADKRFKGAPPTAAIPDNLKTYDLWCGPRKVLPYSNLYHPFDWRGFHEYGMGMLGDWGAHLLDFVHDKLELGLPTNINATRMDDHNHHLFPLFT